MRYPGPPIALDSTRGAAAAPFVESFDSLRPKRRKRGATTPDFDALALIAEATGKPLSYFLGDEQPPTPEVVAMKHRARLSQSERAAFAEAISWASMGTSAQTDGHSLEIVPEASAAEAA